MSSVRFLCDEHVSRALVRGLIAREPGVEVIRVGRPSAPPIGAKDTSLLLECEVTGRTLITIDRRTMPKHVADHLATGHHTWGVFILRPPHVWRRYLEDLILIWSASEAAEWRDRIEYLPWNRAG
jgi:hypothetical protein